MAVNPNTRPFSLKHPVRLIQSKLQSQSVRFVFPRQTTPEKQKGLLFSLNQNHLAHSVQFWTENTFLLQASFQSLIHCMVHAMYDTMMRLHDESSSLKWWNPYLGPSGSFYSSYDIHCLKKDWRCYFSRWTGTFLEPSFLSFHTISQPSCLGSPQAFHNNSCLQLSHSVKNDILKSCLLPGLV